MAFDQKNTKQKERTVVTTTNTTNIRDVGLTGQNAVDAILGITSYARDVAASGSAVANAGLETVQGIQLSGFDSLDRATSTGTARTLGITAVVVAAFFLIGNYVLK